MHSAHSHIKPLSEQNQAGNKLFAVISFLRGILFSCITFNYTLSPRHGIVTANPTLPVLTALTFHQKETPANRAAPGDPVNGKQAKRNKALREDEGEALSATRLPWSTSTLPDRDWGGKQLAKISPEILRALPAAFLLKVSQFCSQWPGTAKTGLVHLLYFFFKWHLSLWYLQVSNVLDFVFQIFTSKPGTIHTDLS